MKKITVDTNTLISAILFSGNEFQLLNKVHNNEVKLLLSAQILLELMDVLSREKFGYSYEQIDKTIKQLLTISTLVIPTVKINFVKEDPDDNIIIECAVSGNAEYIVSGDKHLLRLKQYGHIKIIKTKESLKKLRPENNSTTGLFIRALL